MSKLNCSQCDEVFYVTKRNLVLPFVCAECQDILDTQAQQGQGADWTDPAIVKEPKTLLGIVNGLIAIVKYPKIAKLLDKNNLELDWDQINADLIEVEEIDANSVQATNEMINDLQSQLDTAKVDIDLASALIADMAKQKNKTTADLTLAQKNATTALDQRDEAYRTADLLRQDYFARFFEISALKKQIAQILAREKQEIVWSNHYESRAEYWRNQYTTLRRELQPLKDFKTFVETPWYVRFWRYLSFQHPRWRVAR